MAFAPGHKSKGGRPQGLPNKNKRPFIQAVNSILEWYDADKFISDLKSMDEVDRAKTVIGLAEFAFPKLARSENTQNITVQVQKEAFLIGGKTLYLDGAAPLEIDES